VAIETFGEKGAMEKIDVCAASTSMTNTDSTSLYIGIRSYDSNVQCLDYAK
jgi:hypothetical protein